MSHWVLYRIGDLNELSVQYMEYGFRLAKRTEEFWDKLLDNL